LKRFERLGEARAPDGTVLTLFRRDGDYTIRVAGVELMSTRRFRSEERLAELVCAPLRESAGPRVLIGGLGLGFTLRAALRLLPADAHVVVAEIVPEIVAWNRNPEYGLPGEVLADPRVEVREVDVADMIRGNRDAFDAIMLDVDNGAEALTTDGNAAIYAARGVRKAVASLRSGGRIAYWSADDDPRFEAVLRAAGLDVERFRVRAHATAGGMHTLLVGRAVRGRPSHGRATDASGPASG
jgi:predicted membrane-bound spermidine synthase